MDETAPLPVLQAAGFSASVDAFAWEPDIDPAARRMRLWFVSLLGPQEAVKALWARLIAGEVAILSLPEPAGARFCSLAPEGPRGWQFFTASLRAVAGYHGILVPHAAQYTAERPDFLIVPRHTDEAAGLHYRFLKRRLDLPLHPAWADWLWDRACGTGEAVALESRGLLAYRCLPVTSFEEFAHLLRPSEARRKPVPAGSFRCSARRPGRPVDGRLSRFGACPPA